jgi:hypothetical protein
METTRIHGGTLTFADKGHQYRWNQQKVEYTVSGICGDGFPSNFGMAAGWAAKMIRIELISHMRRLENNEPLRGDSIKPWAEYICQAHIRARDTAGEAGTTFHDYMERYAQGLEPELPEKPLARRSAEALRNWYDANVKQPISTERLVYHPDYDFAGKLDLFVELLNSTTAVIDYKGVTDLKYDPKPGHVGQGAAYCMALRLENIQVDSFILMEVERETGKLRVTRYDDLEREFEAFVWALNLVRYRPQGIEM